MQQSIRTREEIAALYRRHIKMVYQICLVLMKNGRRPNGLSQGDGVRQALS